MPQGREHRVPNRYRVTGCADCPFQHGARCSLPHGPGPDARLFDQLNSGEVHEDCPLQWRAELVFLVTPKARS